MIISHKNISSLTTGLRRRDDIVMMITQHSPSLPVTDHCTVSKLESSEICQTLSQPFKPWQHWEFNTFFLSIVRSDVSSVSSIIYPQLWQCLVASHASDIGDIALAFSVNGSWCLIKCLMTSHCDDLHCTSETCLCQIKVKGWVFNRAVTRDGYEILTPVSRL